MRGQPLNTGCFPQECMEYSLGHWQEQLDSVLCCCPRGYSAPAVREPLQRAQFAPKVLDILSDLCHHGSHRLVSPMRWLAARVLTSPLPACKHLRNPPVLQAARLRKRLARYTSASAANGPCGTEAVVISNCLRWFHNRHCCVRGRRLSPAAASDQ